MLRVPKTRPTPVRSKLWIVVVFLSRPCSTGVLSLCKISVHLYPFTNSYLTVEDSSGPVGSRTRVFDYFISNVYKLS